MTINWFGQGCIRLKGKDVTVVIDPLGEGFGLAVPKLKAEIVCVTHDHRDHNNVAAVAGEPLVIRTPGEYNVKDVYIQGIPAFHDAKNGAERGPVVMYTLTLDGLNIAHLGDLGQPTLTDYQLEALGTVDILILPVGGVYTADAKVASAIVSQLEPKVVIPVHYDVEGLKIDGKDGVLQPVGPFLKEFGSKAEPQDDFKVTHGGLLSDQIIIQVLKPAQS